MRDFFDRMLFDKETNHNCSECALRRKYIGDIEIDPEDIKVYKIINTEISNSIQSSRENSIESLPENISEEEKRQYLKIAFENTTEVRKKLVAWWKYMKIKYGEENVPVTSKVDVEGRRFYHCVDDNDEPILTGEFVPKHK